MSATACASCPQDRPTAGQLAERLEPFLQQGAAEDVSELSTLPAVPAAGRKSRRLRVGALAAVASVALLAGLGWALSKPRKTEEVHEERRNDSPPIVEKPLRIRPLQVMHYRKDEGKEALPRRIGEQSLATHRLDLVTLTVELSDEACFYVIGFNFDGKEQLLWPLDKQGEPSELVAPPRLQRLRYPPGETGITLDDPAPGGLQVYAVAASRQPLPSYAKWKEQRKKVSWKSLPAGKMVWEADCTGTYAMVLGQLTDRGSIKERAGVPPLSGLCRGLRVGGVEVVEAIAFPVLAKEGE